MLAGVGCVLLDLELPDSRGLSGVRWLQEPGRPSPWSC